MSHAVVLVALSPDDIKQSGGSIERAVAWQMEPFNEQGQFFRDGSRWDWWVIGGRWSRTLRNANTATRSELSEADGITPGAFLKNRTWYERERMGWLGAPAKTECQIQAEQQTGEEYTGRCILEQPECGAKIVTFSEPAPPMDLNAFFEGHPQRPDTSRWVELFWARFLRALPPETVLVVVDYHV